jgi:hypothetical protein
MLARAPTRGPTTANGSPAIIGHGAAQSPATLAIGVEIQVCWLKAV